jgi:hypothetical protein
MAQIAKLTQIVVPGSTSDHPVPHGLVRTPGIVVLLHGTHADISEGAAADEDNIYLTNVNVADQNAEVLVWAVHSVVDSSHQVRHQTGTVAAGNEVPVAHGLVRAPSFVCLLHGTDANVSVGATPPDATNFYLDNAGGGGETFAALILAPHSIIS